MTTVLIRFLKLCKVQKTAINQSLKLVKVAGSRCYLQEEEIGGVCI